MRGAEADSDDSGGQCVISDITSPTLSPRLSWKTAVGVGWCSHIFPMSAGILRRDTKFHLFTQSYG